MHRGQADRGPVRAEELKQRGVQVFTVRGGIGRGGEGGECGDQGGLDGGRVGELVEERGADGVEVVRDLPEVWGMKWVRNIGISMWLFVRGGDSYHLGRFRNTWIRLQSR